MSKKSFQTLMHEAEASAELAIEGAKIDFALELGKVMERAGLSRSDLAARLGVSLPMVTKILRGDGNLTIESMVKATHATDAALHIHIIPKTSKGRWFEICGRQPTINRTAPCRHPTERATDWPQENSHEAQPLAA